MNKVCAALALSLALACVAAGSEKAKEDWRKDIGKPAPALNAAGWMGMPVALEAVRGNTLILAFWNADVPC